MHVLKLTMKNPKDGKSHMLRQIHVKISLKRWIISLQKDFMDILHYSVGGVGSVWASLHEPTAQICLWWSGSLKHTIFYFSLFFFSKSLVSASQSRHSRHFTSLWASLRLFVLLCLPPCHSLLSTLYSNLSTHLVVSMRWQLRASPFQTVWHKKSVRNRWERGSRESRPNAKGKRVDINHDQQHHLVAKSSTA